MNGKVKFGIVGCLMTVLFVGVFFVGFYLGYQRHATLNIDVGTHSLHCHWLIEYVDGRVEEQYHAGTLTTIGKNYIEDQLGDSPNATAPAKWISVSTSSDSPAAGWTQIPTEISTNGLERASGTYTSTGDGVWTIHYQFTATGTHTDVQLTGLQWDDAGDNNLLGADTFTPVTLNSDDKLTVTWTITVT